MYTPSKIKCKKEKCDIEIRNTRVKYFSSARASTPIV